MKKLLLSLAIILSIIGCSDDDNLPPEKVYEFDVFLTTQDEVDSFLKDAYTHIEGNLYIGEYGSEYAPIYNLDGLEYLREVEQSIFITSPALEDIEGLRNLKSVGKDLTITSSQLSNLSGLRGLNDASGLALNSNDLLQSIDGLSNLSELHFLVISDNDQLTNIEGLGNIYNIWNMGIWENDNLENLDGFSNLVTVHKIQLYYNASLTSLCGLEKAIKNTTSEKITFIAESNAFNPQLEDIKNGNCSQ